MLFFVTNPSFMNLPLSLSASNIKVLALRCHCLNLAIFAQPLEKV